MLYYKSIHCTEDSSEQMMMKSFRSFHYRHLTGVGDRKFFLGCLMLTLLYDVPYFSVQFLYEEQFIITLTLSTAG